ncbi:MAG: hypothetical protein QOE46_3 [Acidobacteriota bacterium]|nr:hypothetical protein [Acidobacteriota bacterium]
MINFLPWLIVAFILIILVLRFVQPELVYSFRQVLVKIGMRKVFLDRKERREDLSAMYNRLLVKDFRYETLGHDWNYALKRVNKMRELYSTLDLQRGDVAGIDDDERKPQVCIIELANLLSNLGDHVKPERDIHHPTVKADEILRLVGNSIKREGEALQKDNEVEAWFIENPMSIEQTIEIMIAAVFGLAYRQQAEARHAQPEVAGNLGFSFRKPAVLKPKDVS